MFPDNKKQFGLRICPVNDSSCKEKGWHLVNFKSYKAEDLKILFLIFYATTLRYTFSLATSSDGDPLHKIEVSKLATAGGTTC